MPHIPYTKKQIIEMIRQEEEKLLAMGYTEEDLKILREGLECLVYPLIKEMYGEIYK